MNDPVLLLDSTVLVAYERNLTRRAQAVVLETLADGRLMVTAALSQVIFYGLPAHHNSQWLPR